MAIQRWTCRDTPGYVAFSNVAYSDWMNSHACHPFDATATDPATVDALQSAGSKIVIAPVSGSYYLTGGTDNKGTVNLRRNDDFAGSKTISINGFTHSGKSTESITFVKGDQIAIAWEFSNNPNGGTFASNPCCIALVLYGPDTPSVPSVSLNTVPNEESPSVIQGADPGGCVTLAWSATGVDLTSASMTDYTFDEDDYGGSEEFCPVNESAVTTWTKTYTYSATNAGGTSSTTKTITVYIKPTLNLYADGDSTSSNITAGGTSTISWDISGSGSSVVWTSGGLTNNLATSSSTVTLFDDQVYCGYASGLGGTSDTVCVTVNVNQIPVIDEFTAPTTLDYGTDGIIKVDHTYANTSATLEVYYNYGSGDVEHETINLTAATSSKLADKDGTANVVEEFGTGITYNNIGPRSITWILTVVGSGGTKTATQTTTINIDETPDNITIQETDELLKGEDPVYTPDILPEDIVESELYLIDGIDIPVEIKSNYPIKVDINKSGTWTDVREI